jgi:hypothetical protein
MTKERSDRVQQQREQAAERALLSAVGARRVLDAISRSKATLVCHNGLLDVLHIYNTFVGPLPGARCAVRDRCACDHR